MAKPDDIPQDVWERAEVLAALYVEWLGPQVTDGDAEHVLTVSIAKAITGERERCARVARSFVKTHDTGHGITIDPRADAAEIAKAIRGEHQ